MTLGGRSVAEWQATMTVPEFKAWKAFYKLFPFDDFHRFHRPAAMVAQSMSGGDMQPRLEWLQPDSISSHLSDADLATMRAFGHQPPRR